ncbi:MAG: hypothetical protein B6D44_14225 [Ignavibacteriales bacterium UTCHB2]|nr:MAG: hypothetical protein B6D44_14225 [Ignavibacteriales bacterium UTCHB2]
MLFSQTQFLKEIGFVINKYLKILMQVLGLPSPLLEKHFVVFKLHLKDKFTHSEQIEFVLYKFFYNWLNKFNLIKKFFVRIFTLR